MVVWTQSIVNRFLQLFADPSEYRYGEIAEKLSAEFGVTITKNAAIGIGKRLDVPQRKKPGAARKPEIRPEHRHLVVPPVAPKPWPRPRILAGRLRIDQLSHDTCRWPFGDRSPFLFCGAITVESKPYCVEHMKTSCVRWQPSSI